MNDRLEDQLRSSLNRTADARPVSTPDLGDVFGRARTIRRRRTALVAGVAAAAVLAVVVPTAVIMRNDDGDRRGIVPSTPGPSSTATPTPVSPPSASIATDAPAGLGIGGLSIGEHSQWTYLDPQQHLHADGATIPANLLTHGGGNLTGFTPYHGGWILTYDDNTAAQVDSSGKIVRSGSGGAIALSSDDQQTAFEIGGVVYAGISTGMSEAEGSWKLKKGEYLAGYVGKGPIVTNGSGRYAILLPDGTRTEVASELDPAGIAASSQGELVGGTIGTPATTYEGAVADAYTGKILWHNEWRPMAFSPDGTYVAAVPVGDNGDPETYAILDARTGTVVAEAPKAAIADKIYLGWQVVWEPSDDAILFQGFEAGSKQRAALLRLTLDGTFNQASEPLGTMPPDGGAQRSFVLMSR